MTGTEWLVWVVGSVGGLGGLAGFGTLVNAFVSRSKTRAEASQIVVGSVVTAMNEFEEDARQARAEAAQVREEMRTVRTEARALAEELHRIRMAIMSPDATIEGLRALVAAGPGRAVNGQPL